MLVSYTTLAPQPLVKSPLVRHSRIAKLRAVQHRFSTPGVSSLRALCVKQQLVATLRGLHRWVPNFGSNNIIILGSDAATPRQPSAK